MDPQPSTSKECVEMEADIEMDTPTEPILKDEEANEEEINDVNQESSSYSSASASASDSDSDLDYDFVDNMLEEGINGASVESAPKKRKLEDTDGQEPRHEERSRMVLLKRDQNHFEILPEGWVEITHFSGMPLYLHKESRVCTLSKPYLLGKGSARKHDVPISAIPCFQYRREKEKELESESQEMSNENLETGNNPACPMAPIAKVETLKDNKKEKSVNYLSLREYCQQLFDFKSVTIRKFKTWADRRRHTQQIKLAQRPSLPESTKLITCPVLKNSNSAIPGKANKKEFVMNPAGKSAVCILHEFVQHTGRTQPKYKFQELENVSKPYQATVTIQDMEYGVGYGSSKKEAKTEAARASLDILIPDLNNDDTVKDSDELSFFNNIRIEDPRVTDLCLKAGQHSPYQVLVECLRRHYGIKDMDIVTEVKLLKHQKNEYRMKVGEHEAVVICKNKREGKQRAAQAILQKLHTHLNSWGALFKLYGRGSCKTPKEKREEAQQITELQNSACSNRPNYAILNKLREEMLKLKANPPTPVLTAINSILLEPSVETA